MITKVTHATIWVKDQDEALKFYRDTLGFKVTADNTSMPGYRWLTVAPSQQDGFESSSTWPPRPNNWPAWVGRVFSSLRPMMFTPIMPPSKPRA